MFPNAEKAQWLNKIVKQLWPIVKNYIHDIAKDLLEAKLNKKIKKYGLSGLTVEKLVLGSTVRFLVQMLATSYLVTQLSLGAL